MATSLSNEIRFNPINEPNVSDDTIALRRTRREIKPPKRLTLLTNADTNNYSDNPRSIKDAMTSPNWPEWLAAVELELASLKAMDIYTDVEHLPPEKKAIGSKWVLNIKRDENGNLL
jgi:hypothetical protein